MTLDDTIARIEDIRTQRFVARTDIYAQLQEATQELAAYTHQPLTTSTITRLDELSLAFKRTRRSELSDVIKDLDAVRQPYRPQQPTVCYHLISTNFAQYDTRIQEINAVLDEQETSYDDLALTKDWLETNTYLKRKRARDQEFDARARALEKRLDERMSTYAPSQPSRPQTTKPEKKTWYTRAQHTLAKATVGVSAALLTLSTLPTAWYAPFYQ